MLQPKRSKGSSPLPACWPEFPVIGCLADCLPPDWWVRILQPSSCAFRWWPSVSDIFSGSHWSLDVPFLPLRIVRSTPLPCDCLHTFSWGFHCVCNFIYACSSSIFAFVSSDCVGVFICCSVWFLNLPLLIYSCFHFASFWLLSPDHGLVSFFIYIVLCPPWGRWLFS